MNWFTRALAEPTAVPQANPAPSSDEVEIKIIEKAYREAEKEYATAADNVLRYQQQHREAGSVLFVGSRAYVRTNALALNPTLSLLCHVRELSRQKRNSLLNARADLLTRAGKIR